MDRMLALAYLCCLAGSFALRDWKFQLSNESAPEGRNLDIRPIAGRRIAVVRFAPIFASLSPEEVRHAFAHEMVHCHLAHAQTSALTGNARKPEVCDLIVLNFEQAVDGLADAIAPYLPLPPKF